MQKSFCASETDSHRTASVSKETPAMIFTPYEVWSVNVLRLTVAASMTEYALRNRGHTKEGCSNQVIWFRSSYTVDMLNPMFIFCNISNRTKSKVCFMVIEPSTFWAYFALRTFATLLILCEAIYMQRGRQYHLKENGISKSNLMI